MSETQSIEYKESWRDESLRQICGLANTHGGSLFIGVDDKGTVVGLQNAKKLQEDIPNKAKDTLCIVPEVMLLEKDGKEYLEVAVQENATPVSYKNKFYYRSGTVTIELTDTALHTFLLEKMGGQWDGMAVDCVGIEDLDKESFDIFKREAIRSGRMHRNEYPETREELLDKLRLITDDGKLTRAAVLLFHRDPERWVRCAYCKVAKFGKGSNILYHDEVHGSLMMQADRMLDLIYTKYLIPRIRFDGKLRIETYPYPHDSVREGLFNALMHNFYMKCVPIQIRINEDEMWLSNDLAFNSRWTPERLMATHRSEPYNSLIANAFFWAGFVETWGRGIQEMCKGCVEYGCPSPYYIDQPNGIMLIFKAHPDTIALQSLDREEYFQTMKRDLQCTGQNGKVGVNDEKNGLQCTEQNGEVGVNGEKNNLQCTDADESALEIGLLCTLQCIMGNPSVSYEKLAEKLNISRRGLAKRISKLKEKGFIRREGSDKTGYWVVKDIGEMEGEK